MGFSLSSGGVWIWAAFQENCILRDRSFLLDEGAGGFRITYIAHASVEKIENNIPLVFTTSFKCNSCEIVCVSC